MKRKSFVIFLIFVSLIASSIPITNPANAEGIITQEAISAVMSMYNLAGSNKYWTYDSTVSGASTAWTGSDHYASSSSSGQWRQYDSGDYFTGWQCYGFAEFMGWAVTGGTSKNDVPLRSSNWTKYSSKSAYLAAGGLEVGDIIHYWNGSIGHSVMIYEVLSNGKFKVVEVWGSSGNKINWGWVEGYESRSTLSYFDSNKGAWQYGLKYRRNFVIQPETYTNLEFRDVVYPKTFRIDTTHGWYLQGGTLVSDAGLTSIQSIITRDSDEAVIDNYTKTGLSGNIFVVKSIDANVKFSNIMTAGKYTWTLIGKDSSNRTLTMNMPFTAVSSGSTVTDAMSKSYEETNSITIDGERTDPEIGAFQTFTVIPISGDVNVANVVWTIDDESIAKIVNQMMTGDNLNTVVLKNMGIGTTTLRAQVQDGSGVSTEISVTVETNITGASYSVYKWVDGERVYMDIDDIQVEVGQTVCLGASWTWVYEPETYDYQFVLEEISGLEAAEDDSMHTGWFDAKEPGTWYVYLDFFENGQLILDVNQTYEIHVVGDSPSIPDADFILPSALQVIGDEAFAGVNAIYVKLGEDVTEIGDSAFANCGNLKWIYIPTGTVTISDSAFEGTNGLTILGYKNTEAQSYAARLGCAFVALDAPVLSDWVLASEAPENAEIVQTKTQYSFRERGEGSYTAWSDWGEWLENGQTVSNSDLMQEEVKQRYQWWAAQCSSCGHNNPYHGSSSYCYQCGKTLSAGNWVSVFAYSDDTSGMEKIHGRNSGRYFDGAPYWLMSDQTTQYRYRTRRISYTWGDWSSWSDMPATATETREVRTRTMVRYEIN